MNWKCDEMAGVVSPTDSRFRNDQRLYEEGYIEEADSEKWDIEEQQRRVRRQIEEGQREPWVANFFKEIPHSFVKNEDIATGEETPVKFHLIDGPKGYWERRKAGDWSDMPNLFGPFTNQ